MTSSPLVAAANAVVRLWTRVYTAGLPPEARDARRAEIESDLWELEADADARGGLDPASHVLARCLIGIPDDLTWRVEEARLHRTSSRAAAAAALVAALLAAAWFLLSFERTAVPPLPVGAAPLQWRTPVDTPPPPPPPPPPPCAQWNPTTGCSK